MEPEAQIAAFVRAPNGRGATLLETAAVSMAISLKRIADVFEGRVSSGTPGQPGFDSGQPGLADAISNAIYNALVQAGGSR